MTATLNRRLLLPVLLAVSALLALTACSSGSADESAVATAAAQPGAPAELRIGYQAIPNGDLVVKHNQWLEQALPDTNIVWTKFESGGDVNTAMIAGALDIGLAGSSPVTIGLAQPIPYRVPWIFDVIGSAESLVATKDSGVTTVADLAGKKIATPFASTAHYSLLAALKDAGVAEGDVTLVDLQPPDILAAWQRGDIDAAYVWSPTLDDLRKDGGVVLTTSTDVAKAGNPTYDLAVVTDEFAGNHPEAVTVWLEAQNRAVELIGKSPAQAAEAIGAELNLPAADVEQQLKGFQFLTGDEQRSAKWLGTPEQAGDFAATLQATGQFLAEQGKIPQAPDLATLQAGIATQALADAFGSK